VILPVIFFFAYKYVYKDTTLRNLLLLITVFGFWSALTFLWSGYPAITLSRSFYFIFISSGAILAGYLWNNRNFTPLSFLIPANIILIALSLFSLITGIPADSWTGGNAKGFMGFAGHQNTLASALIFTMPGFIYLMLNGRSQTAKAAPASGKTGSLFFWILLLLNIVILILTYSRASVLALITGILIFLILAEKRIILLYSFIAAAAFIIAILIFSPLKEKSIEIINKDFPEFYSSRLFMWEPSFKAALNGGLTGLGYGISDPDILVPGTGSYYAGERYVREKGNSVLAIVEEVGIAGLFFFLLIIGYALQKSFLEMRKSTSVRRDQYAFIIAVISALVIHAQFEAWWTGPGSIHLPIFFCYLGSAVTLSK
jgi:O-antigen ligase